MEKEYMMEERKNFFDRIMRIVDEAEGERDTTYGPFSFLWENSYVRDAVVSSFNTKTSITGLKLFLVTDVLEMHAKGNASKISYEQFRALMQESGKKKYSINYSILDACMDVNKNKEAVCVKMDSEYTLEKVETSVEYVKNSDELFPYIFMDKLRSVVWSNLRDFFKLCEQNVCSECAKKSMTYFQFVQAVALFEIFYIRLIQEPVADDMEKEMSVLNEAAEELNKIKELTTKLNEDKDKLSLEKVLEVQKAIQKVSDRLDEDVMEAFDNSGCHMEVYQLLVIEFGISLNAMCYLLMIFEAMQVCDPKMRGLKHLSKKIGDNLLEIYDRDLLMLTNSSRKRAKRYKGVNKRIEELLKHRYVEERKKYKELHKADEEYGEEDAIYTFMVELCKPVRNQNKELLRGLEGVLGYPIYFEQTNGKQSKQ